MGFLFIIYVQCCTGSWRKRFSKPINVPCTWTCKIKAKLSMKYYKIWNILVFVQKKLTNYLSICAFCRLFDTCIPNLKTFVNLDKGLKTFWWWMHAGGFLEAIWIWLERKARHHHGYQSNLLRFTTCHIWSKNQTKKGGESTRAFLCASLANHTERLFHV